MTKQENDRKNQDTIIELIGGTSITSIKFDKFYIQITGQGGTSDKTYRWYLRTSSKVMIVARHVIKGQQDYGLSSEKCAGLVSLLEDVLVGLRVSENEVSLEFASDMSLHLEREYGESGDLEVYTLGEGLSETLEGLWSL